MDEVKRGLVPGAGGGSGVASQGGTGVSLEPIEIVPFATGTRVRFVGPRDDPRHGCVGTAKGSVQLAFDGPNDLRVEVDWAGKAVANGRWLFSQRWTNVDWLTPDPAANRDADERQHVIELYGKLLGELFPGITATGTASAHAESIVSQIRAKLDRSGVVLDYESAGALHHELIRRAEVALKEALEENRARWDDDPSTALDGDARELRTAFRSALVNQMAQIAQAISHTIHADRMEKR